MSKKISMVSLTNLEPQRNTNRMKKNIGWMDDPNYNTATMETWAGVKLHIEALEKHGYKSIMPIKKIRQGHWCEYPYDEQGVVLWINHKTKRYFEMAN